MLDPSRILVASVLTLSACGASNATPAPPLVPASGVSRGSPQTAAPRPSAIESQTETQPGAAHRLFEETLACWQGGVWSDAQGIPEAQRAEAADRRCRTLEQRVYGTTDKGRYERLRALDQVEVSELKGKLVAIARSDTVDAARADELSKLFDLVADSERETMYVRRAGDRVKKDIAGTRQPGKLHPDEAAAVKPLKRTSAFEALLNADLGDLSHEARAIAILSALDRMETARGLPKHLKVYAVGRTNELLLGVSPPEPSEDVLRPLKGGDWLGYVSKTASASGYPVPERARSLTDREYLAWNGTLMGLGDKLRAETALISDTTALKPMLQKVVMRLENEYHNAKEAVLLAPQPAGPPHRFGPKPR